MAAAVITTLGIAVAAAVVGQLVLTAPAIAQNMTGDNATMMAGSITVGNATGGN